MRSGVNLSQVTPRSSIRKRWQSGCCRIGIRDYPNPGGARSPLIARLPRRFTMSSPTPDKQPGPTSLKLTRAEREAFRQIARQLETTSSRLLRKMVRELIGQGPDLLDKDLLVMREAAYQLSRVGSNLN